MGAALSFILPLVPNLVKAAEAAFAVKPKSGTSKLNAVMQSLQVFFTQLVEGGVVPAGTPTPTADTLQGVIETVLADLKSTNQLTAPAPTATLYLVQGAVTPLSTSVTATSGK